MRSPQQTHYLPFAICSSTYFNDSSCSPLLPPVYTTDNCRGRLAAPIVVKRGRVGTLWREHRRVGGGDATPVRMRRRPGVHGPHQGLVGVRLWVTAGDPCSCVAGERLSPGARHHRSDEDVPGGHEIAAAAAEGVRGRTPSRNRLGIGAGSGKPDPDRGGTQRAGSRLVCERLGRGGRRRGRISCKQFRVALGVERKTREGTGGSAAGFTPS